MFKPYKTNTPNWRKKNSNHYVPLLKDAGVRFKQKGVYETDEWYFYPSKAFAMKKKNTNIRDSIENILKQTKKTQEIKTFKDLVRELSKHFNLKPHKNEKNYYTFTYKKEEHYVVKNKKIIASFYGIYQNKNPKLIYDVIIAIRNV